MSYDWPKMYKAEEQVEQTVIDHVTWHVCEFFEVEEVSELTREQIDSVRDFWDNMNEYSPMNMGYSHVINCWEMENESF